MNERYDVYPELETLGIYPSRELEEEFNFTDFPLAVLTPLRSGLEAVAVRLAVTFGHRDEDKLTNLVFFARHPSRWGRKLRKDEPGFTELSKEWLDIRNNLVRPILGGRVVPGATRPSGSTKMGPLALVNTRMPKSGLGFTTSRNDYKYGVPETIEALKAIAREWHRRHPGIRFMVRDISRQGGGKFGPHKSHRIGLDADVQLWLGRQTVCSTSSKYSSWRPYVEELAAVIRGNPFLPVQRVWFQDKARQTRNVDHIEQGHTCHLHIRFCMPAKYQVQLDLNRVYKAGEKKASYRC